MEPAMSGKDQRFHGSAILVFPAQCNLTPKHFPEANDLEPFAMTEIA
jgi:hypothetical protein